MISIIIPLYNSQKTISQTLESILAQNYTKYEVIIVNDGSRDASLEIINSGQEKFWSRKIRYKIINQENHGAPHARNQGYQASRGNYLLFCDADIILDRDCLRIMRDTLENNPQASYAYSSFRWGRKLFKLFPFDKEKLKKMPYIHSTSLIRKSDFPQCGWDAQIKKLQDWDLWLAFLSETKIGIFIDRVLFQVQTGGTMSSWLPSFAYKLFPFLPQVRKYNEARKIILKKYSNLSDN